MVIRDHLRVLDWCCPFEGRERSVELGIQLVNYGFNKLQSVSVETLWNQVFDSRFVLPFRAVLTLPVPCISKSYVKIKVKLNFYFHTSLWCLKRFYEGLK